MTDSARAAATAGDHLQLRREPLLRPAAGRPAGHTKHTGLSYIYAAACARLFTSNIGAVHGSFRKQQDVCLRGVPLGRGSWKRVL
jgi:hypothetical protein